MIIVVGLMTSSSSLLWIERSDFQAIFMYVTNVRVNDSQLREWKFFRPFPGFELGSWQEIRGQFTTILKHD